MPCATTTLPGQATLLACWTALANRSPGARLVDLPDASVAVFPAVSYLNNAVLTDLADVDCAASSLATLYTDAGVISWAVWVPTDTTAFDGYADRLGAVSDLQRDTTTLVMRTELGPDLRSDQRVVRGSYAAIERLAVTDEPIPVVELGEPDEADGIAAWALIEDGVAVSSAYTFRHGDDCGLYSVGTVPAYRRRGLARVLVAHALADARDRGARTSSLQSTRMGQPLYESLEFRPAGRYEEWVFPEFVVSGVGGAAQLGRRLSEDSFAGRGEVVVACKPVLGGDGR